MWTLNKWGTKNVNQFEKCLKTQIGSRAFIFDTGIGHTCISYGFDSDTKPNASTSPFLVVFAMFTMLYENWGWDSNREMVSSL